jgi:hypothetical protein
LFLAALYHQALQAHGAAAAAAAADLVHVQQLLLPLHLP